MLQIETEAMKSEYEGLYERIIPADNIWRQIGEMVDFKFVEEELRGKYSEEMGRPSESPIRLFKYMMLKDEHKQSDADLVERSKYDMSFKYFLGYRPEDEVIHPSLLTKFRKQRLTDEGIMDKLIGKTVEIGIERGVLKSRKLIVDSTHSLSRYHNRRPHEVIQEQAKKVRKAVYGVDERKKEEMPKKVVGEQMEEHIAYSRELIELIDREERLIENENVRTARNYLEEMIEDNVEQLQTSADAEAKVGHKTADSEFFGFKTHISMTDERIITAAVVTSGEKHDGKQLETLVEKSRAAGVDVAAVIGDGAYSEKENIEYAKGNFELVSRLSSTVVNGSRSKEDEFEYNKDADMFVCRAGHMAASKTKRHNKQEHRKENPRMVYYFDINKCKHCPMREGCYKEGSKSKSYSVSITSDVQNEHMDFQSTDRFKELSSNRYMIEAKNSELKNAHGLARAYSAGIHAFRLQGVIAIFNANLKRILKLLNP